MLAASVTSLGIQDLGKKNLGIKELPTEAADAAFHACRDVPLDNDETYFSYPLSVGKVTNRGLCPAIRACDDTFDAVIGVSECALPSREALPSEKKKECRGVQVTGECVGVCNCPTSP